MGISLDDLMFFQKVNAQAGHLFDQDQMQKNIDKEKANMNTQTPNNESELDDVRNLINNFSAYHLADIPNKNLAEEAILMEQALLSWRDSAVVEAIKNKDKEIEELKEDLEDICYQNSMNEER